MERPLSYMHPFINPAGSGLIDREWYSWLDRLNDVVAWGSFLSGGGLIPSGPPDGPLPTYSIKVFTAYGIKPQPDGLVWNTTTNALRVNFDRPVPNPVPGATEIGKQIIAVGNAVSYTLDPYTPVVVISHPKERDESGLVLRFFALAEGAVGTVVFANFYFNFVIYDLRA